MKVLTELPAIFFIILLTVSLTSCFRRDTALLRYIVTMRLLVTGDDLKHFKAMIASINDITACPRGTQNGSFGSWQMLVCAILLKNIPMGCRNALLPDHLLKEQFINCLTCGQNTCDNLIFFSNPRRQKRELVTFSIST